jgi:hypothetical protein
MAVRSSSVSLAHFCLTLPLTSFQFPSTRFPVHDGYPPVFQNSATPPDELWEEFGRLTKWQGSLRHRPKWWGKLVIELIYETLDPDVAEWLKKNKPPPGLKWHQQLTENYGARKLVSRCYEIVGMSKTCNTIREFRDRVAEHYGKEAVQLTLYLPKRQSSDGETGTPPEAQAGYKIDLDDK